MSDDISATEEWAALRAHASDMRTAHLRELFASDPGRAERFTTTVGGLTLDWSRHRVVDRTVELLLALAERAGVAELLAAMVSGEPVNTTERRPALHTVLRSLDSSGANPVPGGEPNGGGDGPAVGDAAKGGGELTGGAAVGEIGGEGLSPEAAASRGERLEAAQRLAADELARMAEFVRSLRSGDRTGSTGQPIRTLVNLGIGGSHLGPAMACEALAAFRHPRLRCRFATGADPAVLAMTLNGLDPAETLFVVASKSFTTAETLANARAARDWVATALGPDAARRHLAAVTSAPDAAAALGVGRESTFAVWDWVGGRYSLASAMGLPVASSIGFNGFSRMLAGMREVDEHLTTRPLHDNAPVLMGLLAVWYRNFWGCPSRVVLPYSQRLRLLPAYLQQLEMESNGKRVRRCGQAVSYDTAPIVWGGPGTDGQHSFHQMLHQGTTAVPADFIVFASADPDVLPLEGAARRHDMLVANCLAQAAALAFGSDGAKPLRKQKPQQTADRSPAFPARGVAPVPGGDDASLWPHRELPGDRPSTLVTAPQLTPETLGQLIALYEHQTVVQGAVWGINSFDQFGVEHGKNLAGSVLRALHGLSRSSRDGGHDPATLASLRRIACMRSPR